MADSLITKAQVLGTFKKIMRHISLQYEVKDPTNRLWRDYIVNRYRQSNQVDLQKAQTAALNYLYYLESNSKYKVTLFIN